MSHVIGHMTNLCIDALYSFEGRSITKKGFSFAFSFIKDLFRDDDFMGRLLHPLKGISYRGEQVVFDLYSHSAKDKRGRITLHLAIRTQVSCQWQLECTHHTGIVILYPGGWQHYTRAEA